MLAQNITGSVIKVEVIYLTLEQRRKNNLMENIVASMKLRLCLLGLFFLMLSNGIVIPSTPNEGCSFPSFLDTTIYKIGSMHDNNTTRRSIHDHTKL